MKQTLLTVVLLPLLCSFAAPAWADEPRWGDVPGRLKNEDGVERRGEFVFATGTAVATDSVRPGKAFDVARKKSLFKALQCLRIGVSSSVHLEGVTVIRQWEEGRIHFTTVAVPVPAVKDGP